MNIVGTSYSVEGRFDAAPRADQSGLVPWDKRALDLGCLLLSLPFVLPVMLTVAAYIKIVSPGPIFFLQPRVGFCERRFRIYKFRSMKPQVETRTHESHTALLFKSEVAMTKLDDRDPRLIPLGWLLRASALDELAQLINVFRGEMSIVGPRPCLESELEHFQGWQRERFHALPGLTGLWQVSGKNKTTFSQMVAFDVQYARKRSLGLDLWIMFRTFPVLFSQVGEMWQKKFGKKGKP